jgi:hypothetical protein
VLSVNIEKKSTNNVNFEVTDTRLEEKNLGKWFTTNLLSLMLIRQYMQFETKTSSLTDLHVKYNNKEIANTSNTTFLGLTLDNTSSWKNHIVPKLSSTCFTVRAVKPSLSQ